MGRLLIVTSGLSTGGAERMLQKLFANSDFLRSECTLLNLGSRTVLGSEIQSSGVRVENLDLKTKPWKLYLLLKHCVASYRSVVGWMYHGNLVATLIYIFSLKKPERLVWNIRQTLYDISKEKKGTALVIRLNAVFSFLAHKIVFNSHESLKHHKKFGFSPCQLVVIGNGFDEHVFKRNLQDSILPIHGDSIFIGMIARLHPMKNYDGYVSVAKKILKKFPNTHFVFAGPGISKNVFPFTQLEHEDRVHFFGDTEKVQKIYSGLDIFVLNSSWGEAFPNVVGEAMLCECFPIVTRVGDAPYIVGSYGKVISPMSELDLECAIEESICTSKEYLREIAILGRESIIKRFNIKKITRCYLDSMIKEVE